MIVVSYAGNDVYGNHGFVGNPWVDTNVLHRNPAKQRAAYEWQADWLRNMHSSSGDLLISGSAKMLRPLSWCASATHRAMGPLKSMQGKCARRLRCSRSLGSLR